MNIDKITKWKLRYNVLAMKQHEDEESAMVTCAALFSQMYELYGYEVEDIHNLTVFTDCVPTTTCDFKASVPSKGKLFSECWIRCMSHM